MGLNNPILILEGRNAASQNFYIDFCELIIPEKKIALY